MTVWPRQRMQEVAEGIVAVCHGRGEAGVSNAACVFEQDRALIVDTMTFPEMAQGMVREVAHRNACVNAVLNTHHHIDHTGGNRAFPDVPIVAHHETVALLELMTSFPDSFYERLLPRFPDRFTHLQIQLPGASLGQIVVPQGGEVLAFHAAHTPADVAIWFPTSRVLLAGDLSFIGVTPLAAHGLLSGWLQALDTLIALDPIVVVPGHGRIGGVADLVDLRAYLASVLTIGKQAIDEQLTKEEALEAIDPGPVAEWIEAKRTEINVERAMAEARGEINQGNLLATVRKNLLRASTRTA